MSLISLELDILFNKIILKLCTSTKNLTNSPMPLEFIREDLQILVCISVALELKIIFNRLLEFSMKTNDYNLLIDNLIRLLLLSSKRFNSFSLIELQMHDSNWIGLVGLDKDLFNLILTKL